MIATPNERFSGRLNGNRWTGNRWKRALHASGDHRASAVRAASALTKMICSNTG